jgi:hypothetical protein
MYALACMHLSVCTCRRDDNSSRSSMLILGWTKPPCHEYKARRRLVSSKMHHHIRFSWRLVLCDEIIDLIFVALLKCHSLIFGRSQVPAKELIVWTQALPDSESSHPALPDLRSYRNFPPTRCLPLSDGTLQRPKRPPLSPMKSRAEHIYSDLQVMMTWLCKYSELSF